MQPVKPTYRTRLFTFFDEQGTADFTTAELVARFGCSSNVAGRYRKQWKEQHAEVVRRHVTRCIRCGFPAWETNPIGPDGVCLWCKAVEAGIDLGKLVERYGWVGIEQMIESSDAGRLGADCRHRDG